MVMNGRPLQTAIITPMLAPSCHLVRARVYLFNDNGSDSLLILQTEPYHVCCPLALVVIPGAPAFNIPMDVAKGLLTLYRR